jgi:O-antigen/teichoic acid export membrane protein
LNDYGLETPPDDASAQATQQDNMMGSRGSVVSHISDVAEKEELGRNLLIARRTARWISNRRTTIQVVGVVASSNLFGTVFGVVGSLVQAHFISPDDLGFVRKYSVVAGYAMFLSLGLFTILQREYPVLIGRGEHERARRAVAMVQSWCLLTSMVVCGILFCVTVIDVFQGRWREASAWFIQIVAVWATLYLGYLGCTFRSGEEFKRLAKGQFLSSIAGVAVLPFFWVSPFPTLVLRSVTSQIVSSAYLYVVRPVKVGWCLPWREFLNLVKRGLRLFISDYLRYFFWSTVEIWVMYRFAGDIGVGLLIFSKMIVESTNQVSTAINQVYLPRVAQRFGQEGSVRSCLRVAAKPTLLNLGSSFFISGCVWFVLPPIILIAFHKYSEAIPLVRILVLQSFIVSLSLPMYMVTVLEGYREQLAAVIIGLGVFVGTAFFLHANGFHESSVAWGSVAGQTAFALTCLLWIAFKALHEKPAPNT